MLVLSAVILFLRKTDAFYYPQFWAEDGRIFFAQSYTQGFTSFFEPYAGYLHVVPRIIAFVTMVIFPVGMAPAVYNYASLLVTLFVIGNLFSPRFDVKRKSLLALAIVAVPLATNEVFMNVTNIQWILSLALIVTLLKKAPDPSYGNPRLQRLGDYAVIVLCGLTGPFLIFLLPVAAVTYLRKRSSHSRNILIVASLVAAVQMTYIVSETSPISEPYLVTRYQHPWAAVLGQKLFGNLFLGTVLPYDMVPFTLFTVCIIFVSWLLFVSLSVKENRGTAAVVAYYMGIVIAFVVFKFQENPMVLLPPRNGPRYFYIPSVMTAWLLIFSLDHRHLWERYAAGFCLACIVWSSLIFSFHSAPLADYHWRYYSTLLKEKQEIMIPINPPGWYIELHRTQPDQHVMGTPSKSAARYYKA